MAGGNQLGGSSDPKCAAMTAINIGRMTAMAMAMPPPSATGEACALCAPGLSTNPRLMAIRRTKAVPTALMQAPMITARTSRISVLVTFSLMLLKVRRRVYILTADVHEGFVKKELRAKLRGILSGISPESFSEKSRAAAGRLFLEPEYKRAEIMMIYLSHLHELDTTAIVLQAWQDRKKVVAPQISWDSRQMTPIEIRNLDDDVASNNPMGIREPVHGLPIPSELIDLVIVPGLGFDPFGNRLGRGRGFYDRFLSKADFRGIACGFALEEQVVGSIPAGPLDKKMHILVTDAAVRRFDP